MSTKRIVVDELPEDGCCECRFSKVFTSKFGNDKVRCVATNKPVSDFAFGYTKQPRPDWCPLEVEEVCEWNGEYGGYDEHGDIIFFSKKTGCSDVHIQKVSVPNNNFCSNCGKRIKYVESDE